MPMIWCGYPGWCECPCPAHGQRPYFRGLVDTMNLQTLWKIPAGCCVGDTFTKETKMKDLATLRCRAMPQISHILTWCWLDRQLSSLCLWHTKVSHGLECNMVFAKCMQYARSGSTCILFVWNTGCEKACKKTRRLFGEPNNIFLYSHKFYVSPSWVIFIFHMSLAVGRMSGR